MSSSFSNMKIGLFVLLVHAAFASDQSLWNHVLKMESVIVSVEHHGRQFHVWQESKGNFSRYFLTRFFMMWPKQIPNFVIF